MNVLIGCEESQVVCKAFRELGHEAYSCDLLPARGGKPMWHLERGIKGAIKIMRWDLIILHPPCTALSLSGNRWYGKDMPLNYKRSESIWWTLGLWQLAKQHTPRLALENPASVIFQYLNADDVQYVQPYQFGHGEKKKTGFALHSLPRLIPTNEVDGREERVWKMAPGPNRQRDRSVTFQGIAKAMASQWGAL